VSGKIIDGRGADFLARLTSLLRAREERAWTQRFMTGAAGVGAFVVQISLNIPGWPKRIDGDESALAAGETALLSALGFHPAVRVLLCDAAGLALIMAFPGGEGSAGSAKSAKKISVGIEEASEWGRVLDIDVITADAHISRADIGLAPRKCLLCRNDAKVCARMGVHATDDLRSAASELISSVR
jgi:holo-ACP synthase CitX